MNNSPDYATCPGCSGDGEHWVNCHMNVHPVIKEMLRQEIIKPQESIRRFSSGATRDTDENKPDYWGFESALVSKRFGEYMLKHQKQSDGSMRDSNNWKKGMPTLEYVKSLVRHVKDVELVYEGFPQSAREDLEEALCAVMFNARGLLFEVLKQRNYK